MSTSKKRRPPRRKARRERPIIGWREWVGLPDLGVESIKAKIDTGARSSALHATNLRYFERDGQEWVRFVVRPEQRSARGRRTAEAAVVDRRPVMSSSGTSDLRPFVRTTMVVGGRDFPVEINLTDRRDMGFRMLIGRADVRRRFLVDPGRSFLQPSPPKSKDAS